MDKIFLLIPTLFVVTLTFGAPKQEGERLFSLKVRSLLSSKCLACHGGENGKIKGGLDLTTRELMLKGGDSEVSSLVPGKPEESPLFLSATRQHEDDWEPMPPKENDKLSDSQLVALGKWIKLGAPWPNQETQQRYILEERHKVETEEGILVKTSGGLSDDWTYRRYKPEDIWAFRPLVQPDVPENQGNPIDAFIQRKLRKAGYQSAPEADASTLLHRAYFTLIGLPPTPAQSSKFLDAYKNSPEEAWDDLIDELLDSPHYGEQWAQHWLDVARYADTGGYSNDYERSNAWRYRDYVIRSFNNDKPYDQFVIEQLAGDEVWEEQPKGKKDPELLVASSFLRMGPWDPAMVLAPQARQIYLDDVVNSVGQTFLSTTLRCVKCHDHKFDPIPTRDYYRIYSAFSATQLAERPAPFLAEENLKGIEKKKSATQHLYDFANDKYQKLYKKQEDAAKAWFAERGKKYLDEKARTKLPDEEKPPRHVGLNVAEQGRLKVRKQDEWIWKRRLERYEPMVQGVYNGPTPNFLNARRLRMPPKINKQWQSNSHILLGGALEAQGDQVFPGVMSALGIPVSTSSLKQTDPYLLTNSLDGRRLGMAKWIAHPENPLTARSIVNRVWQHHFGKPLAANPNNFGAKGGKPTHPELIDWLAADFVKNGWKFKRLHKLILQSEVFRQSTKHPQLDKLRQVDPNNYLLAYRLPRRLSAEELRDRMLATTGELNPEVGGLPVMPEINLEVALQPRMIQFSLAPAYLPSRTPEERNRRTIYAYRVRGQADPFLEIFNQPNPNDSCEDRVSEVVTPQAFTLLNSDVMSDRSIAFALRLQKEGKGIKKQIQKAFQLCFGRNASKEETQRLHSYVKKMQAYHNKHTPEPETYPTSITRSLVEELSGQTFEYEEILPVFENYVPDKKPADVKPTTRALADLCLLLFNSNEFLYIY